LPDDIAQEASVKLVAKDAGSRFPQFVNVLNELLAKNASLVDGADWAEEYGNYQALVSHAEHLWDDASLLFEHGSYSTALYISIACIEEIGKIGAERFRLAMNEARRSQSASAPIHTTQTAKVAKRKGPAYSHPKKHLLAAGGGALINSRLDRIPGLNAVVKFLEDVEQGKVERLRQSCLYAEVVDGALHIPERATSKEQALFYVALAGELLAEILGFVPSEFERLLAKVKQFEQRQGMEAE
jgi:AbiV family abortive infection protein